MGGGFFFPQKKGGEGGVEIFTGGIILDLESYTIGGYFV